MTFSLSFSDDFWDNCSLEKVDPCKPRTVFDALEVMEDSDWDEMCACIFPGAPAEIIDIEIVMGVIRETNTCTNLDSPVEVWVDQEGDFRIKVWDQDGEINED
jgi:hypothetical protein